MKAARTVTAAIALLATMSGAHAATSIECGKLIDVTTLEVHDNQTIKVEGNLIASVETGFGHASAGELVIDLRSSTCLPGLMDMHVHLTSGNSRPNYYQERYTIGPGEYAAYAMAAATKTLNAGFTTVRDLGDRGGVVLGLRNAINKGVIPGPRVFAAHKPIATTGGHGDPSNGYRPGLHPPVGPTDGVVDGPYEARKAVRQKYKIGADLIKITATGGVLSLAKNSQNPQFKDDELVAIMETAKEYGMHVAAHAHGAEGIKRAVRAGVHSIEHGTFLDDEGIRLMKHHGTWYVPTIAAGKWVGEKAEIDGYFPDVVRPKAAEVGPQIQATFARAYAKGVKIAFGTDTGVSDHGDNAKEFVFMVEAGMPPLEAIQAATLKTAELLDRTQDLGTLDVGKIADIVAVPDDPRADITTMTRVNFVMKSGVVYKGP